MLDTGCKYYNWKLFIYLLDKFHESIISDVNNLKIKLFIKIDFFRPIVL